MSSLRTSTLVVIALAVFACGRSPDADKSAAPLAPPPAQSAVTAVAPPPPPPGPIPGAAIASAAPSPQASASAVPKGDDAKKAKPDKGDVGRAPAATATTTMQKPKCNCTPGDPTCNC